MHKRLIITLIMTIMLICLAACGEDKVKYVSTETDEVGSATETEYSAEVESVAYDESLASTTSEDSTVPVYVCGAVVSPGVYYLSSDSLKAEALELAGGLTEGAALDYVNLAETICSGEKIYFPYADEVTGGFVAGEEDKSGGKVNINTATKEELMTLPGIGESKAEAIIKYRENNGAFQSIEDITNISGIKEGVYNNIKDYIIVN